MNLNLLALIAKTQSDRRLINDKTNWNFFIDREQFSRNLVTAIRYQRRTTLLKLLTYVFGFPVSRIYEGNKTTEPSKNSFLQR